MLAAVSYGGFSACKILGLKVNLVLAIPASSFLENWKLEVVAFNVYLKRMAAFPYG